MVSPHKERAGFGSRAFSSARIRRYTKRRGVTLFMILQKNALGDQFVAAKMITEEQLELALREQQRSGSRLGQILVQLGFMQSDELAAFLGKLAGTTSVKLSRLSIDQAIITLVPPDVARRCLAIPIGRVNGSLTVALADPFDVMSVDMLQQVTGTSMRQARSISLPPARPPSTTPTARYMPVIA